MAIPRSVLAHWSTVKVIFRSDVIFLLKLLESACSYLIHPHFIFSGDCDSDEDCADGLVCWTRTAGEETRAWGCVGVGGSGLPDLDVCLKPEDMPTAKPTNPPTRKPTFAPNQIRFVGENDPPSASFQLQHCQGRITLFGAMYLFFFQPPTQ